MVQSLLADRFKFTMHREMRDVNVNTIEITKGGPKLQPASGNCTKAERSATLAPEEYRCGEFKQGFQIQDHAALQPGWLSAGSYRYSGRSVSVADLARELSSNDLVVDDTGIKGRWDIDVSVETHFSPMTPKTSRSRPAGSMSTTAVSIPHSRSNLD